MKPQEQLCTAVIFFINDLVDSSSILDVSFSRKTENAAAAGGGEGAGGARGGARPKHSASGGSAGGAAAAAASTGRTGSHNKLTAHAPRFPKPKDEGWFLTLGCVERQELLALKRVVLQVKLGPNQDL